MMKKNDGTITLDIFSNAQRFNSWMFDVVEKYINGNVLEIGSGIGNISDYLLKKSEKITMSDVDYKYVKFLKKKYGKDKKVLYLDIEKSELTNKSILKSFDTVVSFNVLEHVKDESMALLNIYSLLKNNGKMVLLVPAYKFLYCNIDRKLKHFRRYEKREFKEKLNKANFELVDCYYFNSFGVFGWWLAGKIQNKDKLPRNYLNLFEFLVPFLKTFDALLSRFFGLSLVIIGKKNEI